MNNGPLKFTELRHGIINLILPKYIIGEDGIIRNRLKNNIIEGWLDYRGYRVVSLMIDKKARTFFVHRLVAALYCFNPDPASYNAVNHIDGNKLNNDYKNLEWCTIAMNNKHAYDTGLLNNIIGENSRTAILSNTTVHMICKLLTEGYSNKEIIEIIGLEYNTSTKAMVTSIRTGRNWKSISSLYDFEKIGSLRKVPVNDVHLICLLILRDMKIKEIMKILNINDSNYKKFKNIVYEIKHGISYRDISSNYFKEYPPTTISKESTLEA